MPLLTQRLWLLVALTLLLLLMSMPRTPRRRAPSLRVMLLWLWRKARR